MEARVIERLLERYEFPDEVQVMDGGTLGLEILPYLDDAGRLVVVDAVQVRQAPGTLVHLMGDAIPTFLDASKVSRHQAVLEDLLAVAALKGTRPGELVFWGVQVESLGVGLELSPAVAAQVPALMERVLGEPACWGIEPRRSGEVIRPA